VEIERDAGNEQVGGIGVDGETLVGAAKSVAVAATERGVRVEAHADFIRDDDQGAGIVIAQAEQAVNFVRGVSLDGIGSQVRVGESGSRKQERQTIE